MSWTPAQRADAMTRACPVKHCGASAGQACHSGVILRATGLPFGEIGPHFERVLPNWTAGSSTHLPKET